ncbi:MAG: isochorismatase family protein [Candidatus Rokubacteria bacterium]|nr:isochorismatase family protein [Candidatus Rokubacteria bacterium]
MELKERDRIYQQSGFGGVYGLGRSPVVIIVDFQYSHTDLRSPIGSENLAPAIEATNRLLDVARKKGIAVVYVNTMYRRDGRDCGLAGLKNAIAFEYQIEGTRWVEIDDRIKPEPGDIRVVKKTADSFFMTPLDYILRNMGVDTIVVTGCSTSGCIRATVASGADLGYRVIIPEEGVSERSLEAHRYNLFDLNARYADVVPLADVIAAIEKLSPPDYHVGRTPRG